MNQKYDMFFFFLLQLALFLEDLFSPMVQDEEGSPAAGALSFQLFDEEHSALAERPRKAIKTTVAKSAATPPPNRPVLTSVVEKTHHQDDEETLVQNGEPGSSKGRGKAGKGAKGKTATGSVGKKQHEILSNAKDLFAKTKASMSDEQLWGNSIRQRAVDAAVKALNAAASPLLSFVEAFPPAEECSRDMQTFCDNLQLRFGVLKTLKSTPFHYETKENLDDSTFQILMSMEVSMLSTLVTHVATMALKHIDQDWFKVNCRGENMKKKVEFWPNRSF